jgi:2-(1,2-epoxy-1,2-dihydrophenyl)acetyl-CoA isomerase
LDYSTIKVSVADAIAVITLSDPASLNAVTPRMLEELGHAMDGVAAPGSGIRAIVLTGEGRAFCAGFNMTVMNASGHDRAAEMAAEGNPSIDKLRDSPMPIVTAVNGPAAGVGSSIALLGDLVVAAESAYFLLAFRHRGFAPDGGATYLISRLAGKARAMELALLGERLPARTALEWGMINRCVPDDQLMPTAMALARSLAAGPTVALGYTRRLIWQGLDSTWSDAVEAEGRVQGVLGVTEDCHEGVRAFLERRPPVFTGH